MAVTIQKTGYHRDPNPEDLQAIARVPGVSRVLPSMDTWVC